MPRCWRCFYCRFTLPPRSRASFSSAVNRIYFSFGFLGALPARHDFLRRHRNGYSARRFYGVRIHRRHFRQLYDDPARVPPHFIFRLPHEPLFLLIALVSARSAWSGFTVRGITPSLQTPITMRFTFRSSCSSAFTTS